jgi:methionine-rich copper-binding protein CopC
MRRILVAAGLLLIASLALASQTVLAHSRPIRFDPAPGAILIAAPGQVTGYFTSELRRDPNWNFIQVKDAQGNTVSTGDVQLSADRLQMSISLKSGLGAGMYLVAWRSWDDTDGEIFGDCYTFFVGQAAADAAVTNKTRLDGGSACERLEISTTEGTPTAAQVATATAPEEEAPADTSGSSSGGSDVPVWALIIGIAGGAVAGLVGGRIIFTRA